MIAQSNVVVNLNFAKGMLQYGEIKETEKL